MAFDFKFPDVGEGITEGEIVRWLVQVGDRVTLDQPLVEMQTDKAVVEIPAPRAGVILERHGEEGEVIPVGNTLVVIGEGEEAREAPKAHPEPETRSAPPPEPPAEPVPAAAPAGEARAHVQAAPATRRLAKEL